MFNFLYSLVGTPADASVYNQSVYPMVSWVTLFTCMALPLCYYLLLNRLLNTARFGNLSSWLTGLVLCSLLGFIFAFSIAKSAEGETNSYIYAFGIVNASFSAILYVIFSLLLKKFSIHSKHIPF